MKPSRLIVAALLLLLPAIHAAPAPAAADPAAASDAAVKARQSALDLAGAFTNDGFKLRDGGCSGTLQPGQSLLVQVNLFAGNQYWFSAATAEPGSSVSLALYDESGALLKTDSVSTTPQPGGNSAKSDDPYANANRTAAGFAPDSSGPCYLRISASGTGPATFALLYSYK